jgi:hypothetical protein
MAQGLPVAVPDSINAGYVPRANLLLDMVACNTGCSPDPPRRAVDGQRQLPTQQLELTGPDHVEPFFSGFLPLCNIRHATHGWRSSRHCRRAAS